MSEHVQIFDALGRKSVTFEPKVDGDVGHDLFAVIAQIEMSLVDRIVAWLTKTKVPMFILWPFSVRSIRSGLHVVMNRGIWCQIRARSSVTRRMLAVIAGNIDSGYRGELFTSLHNIGLKPRIIRSGERYSQVIFYRAVRPNIHKIGPAEFLEKMNVAVRGADGFGSTGR